MVSGEKLLIKLDKIEFGQENKLKEFLVMSALRNISPCRLEIFNLCINANFKESEKLSESCALVLSLFGLDPMVGHVHELLHDFLVFIEYFKN